MKAEATVPARDQPPFEPWVGVLVRPSSEVMSLQEGTVQRVHVGLGDHVEKGQLLVTLEPTAAQAELASQRGSAEVAQAEQALAEIEQRQASDREGRAQESRRFLNVDEASASSYAAQSANMRLRAAIGRVHERQGSLATAQLRLRQTELRAPAFGPRRERKVGTGVAVMVSPFRKEALEARHAPQPDPQRLLDDDPRWLSAAHAVVIAGIMAVAAMLTLARVNEYASGPALVLAAERTNLPARAPGVVEIVLVKPGQRVSAGMPLLLLDAAVERAAVDASAAEFRQQLQRALLEPAEETSRTALAELTSRRAAADAALKARTVIAPWDGVVSDIRVQEGQHVGTGELLLSICRQDDRFEVLAFLPGAVRPELHAGMQLQLRLAGRAGVRQSFVITDVGAQVVGPAEARRYLGPAFADSIEINGPRVMVRAATNTSGFVDDGRSLPFFDGLQGTAEVATGQSTLLVMLMPWIKDLTWQN